MLGTHPRIGDAEGPGPGTRLRRGHPFAASLALVTVAALAVRLLYLFLVAPRSLGFNDSVVYHDAANVLARGQGFVDPVLYVLAHGQKVATAEHPPLFPLVLSVVSFFGGRSVLAHQVACCVLGALAVAAIGLAGRAVGGTRVGLLAAAVAAAYPNLWITDTQVMSETLFAATIAVVVWAAYAFRKRPDPLRAAVLGFAVGLAALTRGEALALLVALVVPLAVAVTSVPGRRRAALLGVALVSSLVVLAPWVGRNLVTFHHPVLLAADSDTVIAGANCHDAYYGPGLGDWAWGCVQSVRASGDESDQALVLRHLGLHYAREHTARLPVVVLAREGRTWSVFRPLQDTAGRTERMALVGVISFYAITPLALAGLLILRRRHRPVWPLLALGGTVVAVSALAYGLIRFRVPWEVASTILAGAALDRLLRARFPYADSS